MAVTVDLGAQAQIVDGWLRDRGMQYEYEADFKVAEINMDQSLKNQARLDRPIDDDLVAQYAADMKNGDEFPPLIVWRDRRGYILVSGIHRTLAAQAAELETFPAFILETDNPTAVAVLTYEANTKHGQPTSPEERAVQALHLVDSGLSQTEAARLLHISAGAVQRSVSTRKARERLRLLGFKGTDRFGEFVTSRLGSLRADEVLQAGAELTRDAGLTTEDVSSLVSRTNAFRSDAEQMEFLVEERKRLQPQISARIGGAVKLPKRIRRVALASGAVAKLEIPTATEIKALPAAYRNTLKQRVTNAQSALTEVSKALGAKP